MGVAVINMELIFIEFGVLKAFYGGTDSMRVVVPCELDSGFGSVLFQHKVKHSHVLLDCLQELLLFSVKMAFESILFMLLILSELVLKTFLKGLERHLVIFVLFLYNLGERVDMRLSFVEVSFHFTFMASYFLL